MGLPAVTPGIVAEIIRAGLAAGWQPGTCGRPPLEMDGEPFLRLPADPTRPPSGSVDDLKGRFLSALREQVAILCPAPPSTVGGSPKTDHVAPGEDPTSVRGQVEPGAAADDGDT